MLKKFIRASAFTLAETLIVMGIVGVIAALTLPNLNSSTNNKEKVAKLQKIYSNLNDAFGRAEAIYGPLGEWCKSNDSSDDCDKRVFERITEFIKYSKKCTVTDCMVFDSNGVSAGDDNKAKYGVILADGTAISFSDYGSGFKQSFYKRVAVKIDLDGMNKGANTQCKDYFQLSIHDGSGVHYSKDYENSPDYSSGCTAWVLVNGNMDYLKTDTGKIGGKCPDGQTLNYSHPTCN